MKSGDGEGTDRVGEGVETRKGGERPSDFREGAWLVCGRVGGPASKKAYLVQSGHKK